MSETERWVKLSEYRITRTDKHTLSIPVFTNFKLINGEIYGNLQGYKVAPEHVNLHYYQN